MANANVIDRVQGAPSPAQGTKAAPPITLLTTVEKLVIDATGATAVVSAQPVAAPTLTNFEGIPFKVRGAFKVLTGGTSTCVVNIYLGTTVVSGNKLGSVTSQSLVTLPSSGFLELYLIWDSVTGKISGLQAGQFGTGSAVIYAALTNTAVAAAAISNLQFCISATNGSSVTGTIFTLTELCLETV